MNRLKNNPCQSLVNFENGERKFLFARQSRGVEKSRDDAFLDVASVRIMRKGQSEGSRQIGDHIGNRRLAVRSRYGDDFIGFIDTCKKIGIQLFCKLPREMRSLQAQGLHKGSGCPYKQDRCDEPD